MLLIQSGDSEINPRPIQRVIRGPFHQEDQRFGQTAGTQSMCNALYSVGYSIIKKVCYWDMDYILTGGNSLYSSLGFRSQLLSVDELPNSIYISNIVMSIIKTNLETDLMTGSLGGQFLQNNNHFNANSSGNGIIFITAGFSFAVIWSHNGCYLFDSHSRDINGFPSPIGASVLLKFGSVYEVQEYIREVYFAQASNMSQYYQIQYLNAVPPPVEVQHFILETLGRKRQRETSIAMRTQLMPSARATIREQSHKRQQKQYVTAVCNSLQIFELPSRFRDLRKLEKIIIAKRLLLKKVTIMQKGQCLKIKGAICNVPINADDICKVLPRGMDNNGNVQLYLKKRLNFKSHILFEAVRPKVAHDVLDFLKKNNALYYDIDVNLDNIPKN